MDSIEKAMFGRQPGFISQPPPIISPTISSVAPVTSAAKDVIEEAVNIAINAPAINTGVIIANKRRTRQSIVLDMERIRRIGLLVPDTQRSR
ncbi:MAG: hypothetical protein ABTQ25_14775, partial [Nitrosomonas ureae]